MVCSERCGDRPQRLALSVRHRRFCLARHKSLPAAPFSITSKNTPFIGKNSTTSTMASATTGPLKTCSRVVSTYLHEVAGVNAGNVHSMRIVAELHRRRGNSARAKELHIEAKALADRINHLLYVDGKGYWRCAQPDGTFNEVRHCYDFLAVLDNMAEDLTSTQKREMSGFFWRELHSRKWMRALAQGDADSTWNIRPDHSCLGAYAAWPPMTAKGLLRSIRRKRSRLGCES